MESKIDDEMIMESMELLDLEMMIQSHESLLKYLGAVDKIHRFLRHIKETRLLKMLLAKDIDKAFETATTIKKTWLLLSKEEIWQGLDTHAVYAKVLIMQLDTNKFALDAEEAESAKRNLCEYIRACEQSQVDVERVTQERLERANVCIEEIPEISEFLPPCPELPAQMAEDNVFQFIAKSK